MNVSIRGLGTSFTKVLLNSADIAVASNGRLTDANQNREVDLDLFPTELFTRLDVYKTPSADMLEGGAADGESAHSHFALGRGAPPGA